MFFGGRGKFKDFFFFDSIDFYSQSLEPLWWSYLFFMWIYWWVFFLQFSFYLYLPLPEFGGLLLTLHKSVSKPLNFVTFLSNIVFLLFTVRRQKSLKSRLGFLLDHSLLRKCFCVYTDKVQVFSENFWKVFCTPSEPFLPFFLLMES